MKQFQYSVVAAVMLAGLGVSAWAQTPAEAELLSAQTAYQAALSAQKNTQAKALDVQTRLEAAQAQLTRSQANVAQLQNTLNQADAERQQNDAALSAAGARLDAAWQAVRGQ